MIQREQDVILAGASFVIGRAESVCVTGPSGSGKTSLLLALAGLLPLTSGSVEIAGELVTSKVSACLRLRRVGFVFQNGELLPELSLVDNVALPARLAGVKLPAAKRAARELLGELGVGHLEDKRPGQVSGGEQQRAAVARALVNQPAVVLADEPTASLDRQRADLLIDHMLRSLANRGAGLLLVTHDPAVARRTNRELRLLGRALVPASS